MQRYLPNAGVDLVPVPFRYYWAPDDATGGIITQLGGPWYEEKPWQVGPNAGVESYGLHWWDGEESNLPAIFRCRSNCLYFEPGGLWLNHAWKWRLLDGDGHVITSGTNFGFGTVRGTFYYIGPDSARAGAVADFADGCTLQRYYSNFLTHEIHDLVPFVRPVAPEPGYTYSLTTLVPVQYGPTGPFGAFGVYEVDAYGVRDTVCAPE